MEIVNIEKEKAKKYPKMHQSKNFELTKCIPKKWMKVGITAFIMNVLMNKKSFAADIEIPTAGFETGGATTSSANIIDLLSHVWIASSSFAVLLIGIIMLVKKIKKKKVSKSSIILFIFFLIVLIALIILHERVFGQSLS